MQVTPLESGQLQGTQLDLGQLLHCLGSSEYDISGSRSNQPLTNQSVGQGNTDEMRNMTQIQTSTHPESFQLGAGGLKDKAKFLVKFVPSTMEGTQPPGQNPGRGSQEMTHSQSDTRGVGSSCEVEKAGDKLFRLSMAIQTRQDNVAPGLIRLEETMVTGTDEELHNMVWAKEELRDVGRKLQELEDMETEAWVLTACLQGEVTRTKRSRDWQAWLQQITDKTLVIKKGCWRSQARLPPVIPALTPAATVHLCSRGSRHLEKVKLPHFSGKTEDYYEFKLQFQQLCRGERYTAIIELTQMKQKLPKDAVATIARSNVTRMQHLYGLKPQIMWATFSFFEF